MTRVHPFESIRSSPSINILAVDTTGEVLSLALQAEDKRFSVQRLLRRKACDEVLLDAVDRLLARAGLGLGELDAIAASSGPGRFTGIRVGMAYAAVAASQLGIKSLAVSLLEAAAASAMEPLVCAVVAGVRGEKYCQLFRRGKTAPRASAPPLWVRAEDWAGVRREMEGRGAVIREPALGAGDLLAPAAGFLRSGRCPKFEPLYLKPATFQKLKP